MHHAYLLIGNPNEIRASLHSVHIQSTSECRSYDYETFGIDEARRLKLESSLTSVKGGIIFILSFNTITIEAQQALLKLIEEPESGVSFYILAQHEDQLQSTLRSRCIIERRTQKEEACDKEEAKAYCLLAAGLVQEAGLELRLGSARAIRLDLAGHGKNK